MIDPKDVTIIIPHLGGTTESEYALNECIQSLIETAPDIRRIVALNGVKCDSQKHLDFDQKPFDLITVEDQGQELAVNAAVAIVNTPWIFVTNDDMVYSENWFEKLIEGIPPTVMCLSPQLVEPRQGAITFLEYFCGGAGGDFDKTKWLAFAKNHQGTGYRTGFNLPFLIKKELWDLIGGYDVAYSPWGSNSDSDLQAKIHLAGVQPYQNTNSIVYHFSQTSGTGNSDNRPYWEKNWHYFISKWGFERQSSPMVWESREIIDYDKLIYHPGWEGHYAH